MLIPTFLALAALAGQTPSSVASAPPDLAERTVMYPETAISPDGKHVAWVEALRNADGSESRRTALMLDGKRITAGDGKADCDEHGLAWSPRSERLAFLSDCEKAKELQLYTVQVSGGKARRLTSATGFLTDARWSPDGKTIGVLFTENAKRAAGPLEPSLKDEGVVEEKFFEQRLALVDADSGAMRQITPADTYVYEYDWAPDGHRVAFTSAKGNGDNNWWVAELWTADTAGGAMRHVLKPPAQIATPRYTRDGKQICFISGIMSDEGSTGGDIYAVNAKGGEATNLTPKRHASPSSVMPLQNGRILFTETVDGSTAVGLLNPANGVAETLWRGDESLRAGMDVLSVASDGRTVATVRTSWQSPPEVWAGRLGDWSARTHGNDGLRPAWGRTEKIHWTSDGAAVEGWLMYPANYNPAEHYPMVVSVHGGPAAANKPHWPGWFDMSWLSPKGYFVLFPNPRGSYGAGEDFTRGNVADFGYGDLRDINAGVDYVLGSFPVDARTRRNCRLELRRLYDDVDGDADYAISSGGSGSGRCGLAELLRGKSD